MISNILEPLMKTHTLVFIRVAPSFVTVRPLVVFGWMVFAALFAPSVLASTAPADVTAPIRLLENELTAAFNKYDTAALDRLWDRDLTFVFPNGIQAGKIERLSAMQKVPADVPQSANESVDVSMLRDAAVAIVVSRWPGMRDGKAFFMRFRATHVWVKRGDDWRLLAAHVSQIKD